jgi:hypothetical protein
MKYNMEYYQVSVDEPITDICGTSHGCIDSSYGTSNADDIEADRKRREEVHHSLDKMYEELSNNPNGELKQINLGM